MTHRHPCSILLYPFVGARCPSCRDRPLHWLPSAPSWGSLASQWHPWSWSWQLNARFLWVKVLLLA